MLDHLEVAWSNIGTASIDLELPDVIQYADVQSQWETYKYVLLKSIEEDSYYPTSVEVVDLPKDALAVRPLARLEISHRLCYEAFVVSIAPRLSRSIANCVYSSRWWSQRRRFLSPIRWWIKMQRAARYYHEKNPGLLMANTDISSFYEHIDLDILMDDLRQLHVPVDKLDLLDRFLRAFNQLSSAWGIPQGSDMSGLLANVYLNTFDAEIRRSGLRHFRYSDDTYIFGGNWDQLRTVLIRANKTLRHRHLNLAASKTHVFESAKVADQLEDKEKDAINYGIRTLADWAPSDLRSLFDRSIVGETPNTRNIKFCLTNFANLDDAHAVEWLLHNFARVPHIAREVIVHLDHFSKFDLPVAAKLQKLLPTAEIRQYPYAQQHLLAHFIRNNTRSKQTSDEAWRILLDRNGETFVREMAARYLGLFGPPGETGRLKQEYQTESNHRVRRALLVACYESNQCSHDWLLTVSKSDTELRLTADYLQAKPSFIPRPAIERPPWR